MNDTVNNHLEAFRRMDQFCGSRASDFAPASFASQLFTTLSTQVSDLVNLTATQASGAGAAQQGTDLRSDARADLRSRLKAYSQTAQAIAIDVPGLENKFRMPRGATDEELIAAGHSFAADAVEFSAQFIAHEMPPTFIEDLKASTARIEHSLGHQSSAVNDRVGSRTAIEKKLDELMITRRRLDPIVRNKYADDPATLAEWTRVRHITRPSKKKDDEEPPQTTPATT